jgi:hypothetical protein
VTDGRIPWRIGTARCGGYATVGHTGAPHQCGALVTHAGLVLQQEPVAAWLAFSCQQHRDQLIGARLLLERDRAVLADSAERERRALAGQGWDSPQPLATGSAARELVRRARVIVGNRLPLRHASVACRKLIYGGLW